MSGQSAKRSLDDWGQAPAPLPGQLIAARRKRLGLSQTQLAQALGVSARTVRNWETDQSYPRPDTLERLLAFLLQQGAFTPGREIEEAQRLWDGIKDVYDAVPDRPQVYAFLDPRRLQGLISEDAASSPAPPQTPPDNLPASRTTLVGRRRELAEIKEALATTRLLTLTGPGGVGKTTLLLQAARELRGEYPDGVHLVDLTAVNDPEHVVIAAAQALGLREMAGEALLTTIAAHVQNRRLLLLPDNCEHLLDACAALATALLDASSNLQILASSREPLHVRGEAVYTLVPLRVPAAEPAAADDVSALLESEAVQLFCLRAQAAHAGFRLSPQNAAAVAAICRRVDGLPLALELAAAAVRWIGAAGRLPEGELRPAAGRLPGRPAPAADPARLPRVELRPPR